MTWKKLPVANIYGNYTGPPGSKYIGNWKMRDLVYGEIFSRLSEQFGHHHLGSNFTGSIVGNHKQ